MGHKLILSSFIYYKVNQKAAKDYIKIFKNT